MYWDQDQGTYALATQNDNSGASTVQNNPDISNAAASSSSSNANNANDVATTEKDSENKKGDQKPDKVKVAKKIVKDMERWAKQLNQKKDMNAYQAVQPQTSAKDEEIATPSIRQQPLQRMASGYADVGFTIMENRDNRLKSGLNSSANPLNKALPAAYTSDSDNETTEQQSSNSLSDSLIDYSKLACLLCKRAFQSLDILNKHIKMSNLHKENLQKHNLNMQNNSQNSSSPTSSLSYRDRAKERRLKYGEADPPPPNRSRERFEKEMRKQTAQAQKQASSNLASTPIDESNVGNRLLQKMGWSEGQGLGRSNQGRTNIIEVRTFTNNTKNK